jgi:hypothetical protein
LHDEALPLLAMLRDELRQRSAEAVRHAEDGVALDGDAKLLAAMRQLELDALAALQCL